MRKRAYNPLIDPDRRVGAADRRRGAVVEKRPAKPHEVFDLDIHFERRSGVDKRKPWQRTDPSDRRRGNRRKGKQDNGIKPGHIKPAHVFEVKP